MDANIEKKRHELEIWDRIDDFLGMEEEEIIARNKVNAELLRDLNRKESMLYQKAKARRILEGDVNSNFSHRWINKRSKLSKISGIMVNGR